VPDVVEKKVHWSLKKLKMEKHKNLVHCFVFFVMVSRIFNEN